MEMLYRKHHNSNLHNSNLKADPIPSPSLSHTRLFFLLWTLQNLPFCLGQVCRELLLITEHTSAPAPNIKRSNDIPKVKGEVTEIYFPSQPSKQTLSQTGHTAALTGVMALLQLFHTNGFG